MSAKNEHYLKEISRLKQELETQKKLYKVCRDNLKFRNQELSLATQQLHFIYKKISQMFGSEQASSILSAWNNSVTKRVVLDSFNIEKQAQAAQEALGEEFVSEEDERSCKKHYARQEACAAFKEES